MGAIMLKLSMKSIAQIIEDSTTFDCDCTVKEIWLDFGAGIKGDNIVVSSTGRSYQLFCPRDLDLIKYGCYSIQSLEELIEGMNKKGW
jgi:hypothetical protein